MVVIGEFMCNLMGNNKQKLGVLLKRDDFSCPRIKELRLALDIHLFEIDIVLQAIDAFNHKKLHFFDTLVGDRKCQVRVSMLLDILKSCEIDYEKLKTERCKIITLRLRVLHHIELVASDKCLEIQRALQSAKHLFTMHDFFTKNNLNYNVPYEVLMISLCFFTTLTLREIELRFNTDLSKTKVKELWFLAKKQTSLMSIDYELCLARLTHNAELSTVLQVVETKGCCSMTAFFPSLKPVLEKIKWQQQFIVQKIVKLCECAGIQDVQYQMFQAKNGFFKQTLLKPLIDGVAIIEGYQFEGSLSKLKNILNLSHDQMGIKQQLLKACECQRPQSAGLFFNDQNIEEAVLANAAQHPQFTNDAQIDWAGLGLLDSDLKKEFDYLNTLSGYSIHDMSKFCINHIYASTAAQVLEEQKAVQATLKTQSKVRRSSQIPGIQKPDLALI